MGTNTEVIKDPPTIDTAIENEAYKKVADQAVEIATEVFHISFFEEEEPQSKEEKIALAAQNIRTILDYLTSNEVPEGAERACKAGCSFCCHMSVSMTPMEAFEIIKYVNFYYSTDQVKIFRDQIAENAEKIKPLTRGEQVAARIPCAMLGADGECSAYSVRPLNCRKWYSFSKEECKSAFNAPGARGNVKIDGRAFLRGTGVAGGLALGLRSIGVDFQEYEFHSVLLRAFDTPDGLTRWLSGEKIFVGCRIPQPT